MEIGLASQSGKILEHLKRGRTITPLEALKLFGVLRLGGRIFDLRREGHEIETLWETDGTKRWARYRLVKGAKNATAA